MGKRHIGVRVWLTHPERYMHLLCYAPIDYLDIVAIRVEGIASSWVNAALHDVVAGSRLVFRTLDQFKESMV